MMLLWPELHVKELQIYTTNLLHLNERTSPVGFSSIALTIRIPRLAGTAVTTTRFQLSNLTFPKIINFGSISLLSCDLPIADETSCYVRLPVEIAT